MSKPTIELPDTPSELLTLALDDLNKIERSKKYKVHMGRWHEPYSNGDTVCHVCLAGAVMARRGGLSPEEEQLLIRSIWETDKKLDALDDFRGGHMRPGLESWN